VFPVQKIKVTFKTGILFALLGRKLSHFHSFNGYIVYIYLYNVDMTALNRMSNIF